MSRTGIILGALIVLGACTAAGAWALASGGRANSSPAAAASAPPSAAATTPGHASTPGHAATPGHTATPAAQQASAAATPAASPPPRDCSRTPHLCGYPDATSAGVPAGLTLRQVPAQVSRGPGWYYDPRGWVEVSGNGAVLQGLAITHTIDITASDVTIKDVRVTLGGSNFGVDLRHTHNVTIEDSDISSPYADSRRLLVGVKDVYGDSAGTRVLGNNIWHTATGVQVGEGLIASNYIHDVGYRAGDHVNGITVNGGTVPLTIRHNTVFVDLDQTDAISLFEDFGVEANKTIEDNLVAGGGYSIYGGQNSGGPAAYSIRIIGNRISRKYYRHGGRFGPLAAFNPSERGNTWSGNTWDGSGATVAAG